jgi:hypothetical protein
MIIIIIDGRTNNKTDIDYKRRGGNNSKPKLVTCSVISTSCDNGKLNKK